MCSCAHLPTRAAMLWKRHWEQFRSSDCSRSSIAWGLTENQGLSAGTSGATRRPMKQPGRAAVTLPRLFTLAGFSARRALVVLVWPFALVACQRQPVPAAPTMAAGALAPADFDLP